MSDFIVRDSSVWESPYSMGAVNKPDLRIRIGQVIKSRWPKEEDGLPVQYIVEVFDRGRRTPMMCIATSRFGGIYNYESSPVFDTINRCNIYFNDYCSYFGVQLFNFYSLL